MAQEAVKVIVRCRPLNGREKDLNCTTVVSMASTCGQCSIVHPEDLQAPPKTFTFDGAYFIDSTTEQIYNEIVYPIVESVTEGYNATVFAYGQTGCGKSFSMQGIPNPPAQRGIIPRSFEHIFEAINTTENAKFLVHASYLEIYNEEIRDLLGNDPKKKLDLKEHPEKGVYTPGLSMHPVHNVRECEEVMDRGWKNRSTGATLMNADSSRSHSIFTISMEKMNVEDAGEHIKQGKLNLVDLAGSERQGKTGATGDRLKEATKINLSLSALGNVISALVDGKSTHIPYRDSKLTRLLQDSLGGNTKTLMVACLSPADNNYDETLSTLRYANRAKNITNKPRINEDPKDALLREYQEEIRRLKSLLSGELPAPVAEANHRSSTSNGQVDVVLAAVREEYDAKMEDLMDKYKKEQENNAQLHSDVNKLKEHYEQELQKLLKQRQNLEAESTTVENVEESHQNGGTESPIPTIEAEEPVPPTLEEMQAHALERLQELEEKMVGGEKINDRALKENRAKRKNLAEKRLKALSEALSKLDDDDRVMLKVYDDIHEELKAKTSLVKKAKKKIQALEAEINDLHREFESDRTDYLETIRRQDQQVKLIQQILDKIHPCLRRDCNYANLDRIKADSHWDEEIQRWRMPDLMVIRTKLPPPGVQPGGRPVVTNGVHSANSLPNYYNSDGENNNENGQEDKFFQKLERSVQEDVAGNYFRPKRQEQLLTSRRAPNGFKGNGLSTVLQASNLLQASQNGHSHSSNNLSGNSSPEDRKPGRLQALAALGGAMGHDPGGGLLRKGKRSRGRHFEAPGHLDLLA